MTILSEITNAIKTVDSISRFFVRLSLIISVILLVPLIAMQFTEEVNWSLFDFVFMWLLLVGAGMTYKLVSRKLGNIAYRTAVGVAVVTSVLLVWINGAVGIIGDGPVNTMYLGVLVVGVIGSIVAQFRPKGMAWAMFVTAIAQALVPVIALVVWNNKISWEPGVLPVFGLNAVFVMLYVISGALFRSVPKE